MSLYDATARNLDGQEVSLADFRGKVLLIVNVASRCGFTPQYAGLEALYRRHRDRGLVVLGFPCNQFGQQEPGDAEQIRAFFTATYGVTFPVFAKIDVNGPGAHPIYRQLKRAKPGLLGTQSVKWNFTKFLVDRQGRVVRRFAPSVPPEKLQSAIQRLL